MRLSLNWLRQWVPTDLDADGVADRLTAAGLEVDEIQPVGEGLDGVVVAEIVECRPHPDADRLKVCEVVFGADAPVTIVCGASNARAGLKAPLATVGAFLPNGLKIKTATLRGVASEGMLCSALELGLGEDASGLLELSDALEVGTPLAQALGLPDHAIEVDLTPNRADCLSLRGIARELAAVVSLECREPEIMPVPALLDEAVDIELLAPEDCPRYVGRLIRGIDPEAATPAWMVERLERSGLRSRSPVVDVTNYVLLELGQPMHAFDAGAIDGGIRVRRAQAGDHITLLDGQGVEPDEDMLLICDHARPVALAGIMGGQDSAVDQATGDILLESAWFNPASIIGRGRRLGLATDSAHRFERGVDPALQITAIERATALILEIAGGRAGPVVDRCVPDRMPVTPSIRLRLSRVNQVLGTELDGQRVADILQRLGMTVHREHDEYQVQPPSARRDLAIEVDLIEEVARLVGYDRLPSSLPGGRLRAIAPSERSVDMEKLRGTLQARGFQEIMTWSFVAEKDLARLSLQDSAQPLANPLSQDMDVLRTSLLPGLVRTASANLRHQQTRLKLFETGHVFSAGKHWTEAERVGLLVGGAVQPEHWLGERREFDFYDLKGDVEHLAGCLGHPSESLQIETRRVGFLHPGQSGVFTLHGRELGVVGQLHPAVAAELDLAVTVYVAELDLGLLRRRALPQFAGTARFPSVRRDLAMIVPEDVPACELQRVSAKAAGQMLERCIIFDMYQGEGIESGYKSIAIGLILRDVSRTLTDEEVDSVMLSVVESLKQECRARIRG